MKTKLAGLSILCCLAVAVTASAQTLNSPFRIYMRANGDATCHLNPYDAACGRSYAAAVRTLAQVHQILANAGFDDEDWATRVNASVEVRISPTDGVYYGQTIRWKMTNPGYSITFMPRRDDNVRPVFVGCTDASRKTCELTDFFVVHKAGPTNVHFKYIRVERYANGLTLRTSDTGPSNSGNSVYGCYFYQMGANWITAGSPSAVGALNIRNSDGNAVENNHFVSIRNKSVDDGHMHALYMSHGSDYNYIARNRFYDSAGEAFRIRNWSWYNVVVDNVFSKVGDGEHDAGYGDWYDIDGNNDVNEAGAGDDERSSCGNEFRNNILDGRFDCGGALNVFTYHDLPNRCPAGVPRLSTSGNVKTSTPCSY